MSCRINNVINLVIEEIKVKWKEILVVEYIIVWVVVRGYRVIWMKF